MWVGQKLNKYGYIFKLDQRLEYTSGLRMLSSTYLCIGGLVCTLPLLLHVSHLCISDFEYFYLYTQVAPAFTADNLLVPHVFGDTTHISPQSKAYIPEDLVGLLTKFGCYACVKYESGCQVGKWTCCQGRQGGIVF